jgi:hypothetical protein
MWKSRPARKVAILAGVVITVGRSVAREGGRDQEWKSNCGVPSRLVSGPVWRQVSVRTGPSLRYIGSTTSC